MQVEVRRCSTCIGVEVCGGDGGPEEGEGEDKEGAGEVEEVHPRQAHHQPG